MRNIGSVLVLVGLTFPTFQDALAASSEETIAQLLAQIQTLTARIEAVEQAQSKSTVVERSYPTLTSTPTSTPTSTLTSTPTSTLTQIAKAQPTWTDTIKMKGDFRYRHEAFDVDNRRDRHRQRMRARVGLTGKVSDQVSAGFSLASGGSDPTSTNQSFDDASSSKNVVIDLAYISWKAPVDGLSVNAGKFKNPFYRVGGNGLIWDGDLNPEGAGVSYENGNVFANGIASWLDESSSDDDSFLLGGQFGIGHDISQDSSFIAGVSYFNYVDSVGEPAFYAGDGRGNRLNTDGEYLSGFELVEGFVEYSLRFQDVNIMLFADYVQNLDADDYDQGYALGTQLQGGDWQLGYTYQDLEADAVLGTFTDSDFIGGGTDGKGHIFQASYALSKQIGLKGTFFLNEQNIDFGLEEDFKRLMLDISFKY